MHAQGLNEWFYGSKNILVRLNFHFLLSYTYYHNLNQKKDNGNRKLNQNQTEPQQVYVSCITTSLHAKVKQTAI